MAPYGRSSAVFGALYVKVVLFILRSRAFHIARHLTNVGFFISYCRCLTLLRLSRICTPVINVTPSIVDGESLIPETVQL